MTKCYLLEFVYIGAISIRVNLNLYFEKLDKLDLRLNSIILIKDHQHLSICMANQEIAITYQH